MLIIEVSFYENRPFVYGYNQFISVHFFSFSSLHRIEFLGNLPLNKFIKEIDTHFILQINTCIANLHMVIQ